MKQRTILREATTHGKALHTGQTVHLTLKPAAAGQGIIFRRVDLYGKPEIQPRIELVNNQLVRSTDISSGHTHLHTIEHVLSALAGMGIDNCIVEMDGSEPPILDGSAKHFVNLIQKAEPVELEAEREYYVLDEPISVTEGNRSIIALPYDGLKITCTSADDRGIHTQHLSIDIEPERYIAEIAPSRTFTIYEDIEPLLKMGKIQGGSLDAAIVIKGNQILSKEPLRYTDEFVRHKILDIVGDISLLGKPLKAHIVAVRPGHKLNSELTKKLFERMTKPPAAKALDPIRLPTRKGHKLAPDEKTIGIRRILDILPHAYPFVLVDRVIDIKSDTELVAIKNVTINEPFFVGHYPGNPVMPGVLQVEAMAQASGLLMLRKISSEGKVALFMSMDKVKFRRAVVPGDQLLIEVKILRTRGDRLAVAQCRCTVEGDLASSGELMFTIMDVPEEGM
jgi:UDP-3-O-[3-hydroxymyristoyl] N-acetylglucosamine deacetylase / 3-hydroxyacyl-[acyl-carrier-protein] dehydratase